MLYILFDEIKYIGKDNYIKLRFSLMKNNETHAIFRVVPIAPKYKICKPSRSKMVNYDHSIFYAKNCELGKKLRIIYLALLPVRS